MEFLGYNMIKFGWFLILILDKAFAQTYKAAVIAYHPERNPVDTPDQIIVRNKDRFLMFMEEVKHKADIVIFPENGLTTLEPNSRSKSHLDAYAIDVPDVKSNFSCESNQNNVLAGLSCGAKSNGIYVVINVVEKLEGKDDAKYYSTNVVFDSEGRLILKCRKKHPYNGTNYENGDPNQDCTFEAKFKNNNKVKFALIFDTDMLFTANNEVYDVILTSSIKNTLPLFSGLSIQHGYSVRNKINLLASGYTDRKLAYGSSGIYLRNGTSRVFIDSDPLIGEIHVDKNRKVDTKVDVKPPRLSVNASEMQYENIPVLNDTQLNTGFNFNDKNYCRFKMTNEDSIEPYRWVALNGGIQFLDQNLPNVVICGLIKPAGKREKIINTVTISMTLSPDVIQLLPISLTSGYVPANFKFEENNIDSTKTMTMSLTQNADLLSFGVVAILKDSISGSSSVHVFHIFTVGLPLLLVISSKYFM